MKWYAEYKDSGIEWIGEIPKDWEIKKISWIFEIVNSGTTPKSEIKDYYDGEIPWLNTGDLNDGDISETSKHVNSTALAECSALRIYPANSLVVAMYGATIGKLGITKIELCTNQACCVLSNPGDNHIKFLFYLFMGARQHLISLSLGGGQPNISQGIIKALKICMPNIDLQKIIADYLDRKTAAIDILIADKQKLIDLLKEKRQAIINDAVTKGLYKNAKMKDSGIEWIGEIPEGWEVKPLFAVAYENKTKNTGNLCDNLLSLSYGKIVNKNIETNFGLLPESFEAYQIVEEGYTILRLTDLQNDKRSLRSGYVPEKGIITSAYVGLIPTDEIDALFFADLLHAYDLMKIYYGLGNGVRQSMSYSDLKRLPIIVPPKDEQKRISRHLNVKTVKIDALVADIQTQIEKLKEYRQSIISEAVTGKVAI